MSCGLFLNCTDKFFLIVKTFFDYDVVIIRAF